MASAKRPRSKGDAPGAWGDDAAGKVDPFAPATDASGPSAKRGKGKGGVSPGPPPSRERGELDGMADEAKQAEWLTAKLRRILTPRGAGEPVGPDMAELWVGLPAGWDRCVVEGSWPDIPLTKVLASRERPTPPKGEEGWMERAWRMVQERRGAAEAAGADDVSSWRAHRPGQGLPDAALPAVVAAAAAARHSAAAGMTATRSLEAVLPPVWGRSGPGDTRGLGALVISSSANRCTDVLRALQPLKCRCAKLWARHMRVPEQMAALRGLAPAGGAGRGRGRGGGRGGGIGRGRGRGGPGRGPSTGDGQLPAIGVGTPGRILALAQSGAFGARVAARLGAPAPRHEMCPPCLVVVDMRGDGKGFTPLTPGQAGISDELARLLAALSGPDDEAEAWSRPHVMMF